MNLDLIRLRREQTKTAVQVFWKAINMNFPSNCTCVPDEFLTQGTLQKKQWASPHSLDICWETIDRKTPFKKQRDSKAEQVWKELYLKTVLHVRIRRFSFLFILIAVFNTSYNGTESKMGKIFVDIGRANGTLYAPMTCQSHTENYIFRHASVHCSLSE